MAEDKKAVEEFGSTSSGASLGDILGAALTKKAAKAEEEKPAKKKAKKEEA